MSFYYKKFFFLFNVKERKRKKNDKVMLLKVFNTKTTFLFQDTKSKIIVSNKDKI